jgi:hypothetical protein
MVLNFFVHVPNIYVLEVDIVSLPLTLVPLQQPCLERPSITIRHYIVPKVLKYVNKLFIHIN